MCTSFSVPVSAGAESHKREYPAPGMISSWNWQNQPRTRQRKEQRERRTSSPVSKLRTSTSLGETPSDIKHPGQQHNECPESKEVHVQSREAFATALSGRDSQAKRTAPAGQPQESTKKAASVDPQEAQISAGTALARPPKGRDQRALTVKYKKMPILSSSE